MEEQKSGLLIFALSLALALMLYFYFGSQLNRQNVKQSTENKTQVSQKKSTTFKFSGENIRIETKKFIAVVNTQGGVLRSLRLKEYMGDDGKPMELIPKRGFFWNVADAESLTERLNRAIYGYRIKDEKNKTVLILYTQLGNSTLEKTYGFYKDSYKIELSFNTPNIGVSFGPRVAPKDRKARYSFVGPLVFDGKKVKEVKLKKHPEESFKSPVWVALQSLYFTVTLIPEKPVDAVIKKEQKGSYYITLKPEKGNLFISWGFAGPKKYELLKSYGMKLEENIRFGIFGIISKPLLYLMNWLYKIIPNYGVAIIIITFIIKLIFHPLSVKAYKSMNKMKELQPLINQIREAYKDDPSKMNQELMELYRKHKINPFGGCLPLLLQIPVFFALYKLLMVSIELRHAPFILWITDLSAKDPYYVTPILMGLTMLVQQLLTPGQDLSQNKFMLALPVIFTIIFLNFPSGLCLYFLVSNILSIGEQLLIKYVYS